MIKEKSGYCILAILFIADCILPFILGYFYEGYSHKSMLLSVLGNKTSPVHIIYRVWMGVLGIGIIWTSFIIFKDFKETSMLLSGLLLAITICYGVFDCIVSCFFEIGESKEMVNVAAKIHGIGSAVGSTLFLFCGLLIGKLLKKTGDVGSARACLIFFILAIIVFGLFIASDKPELRETIGKYEGIWQRLAYGTMYVPFIILAIQMVTKSN